MTATGRMALAERLSDWLHPIVLRDVQQATRGRVYSATLVLSCVAVTTIGLLVVDADTRSLDVSRWLLTTTLRCLAPVVLFAIPFQAFLSLREEVAEETADQLILTSMRPISVVTGMMLAALLQAVLFIALFAPLLAFSYLLLGVDVPTLLQALWSGLLACGVMTAGTFALIRLQAVRILREHVGLVVLGVLGTVTAVAIARMETIVQAFESVARSGSFWLAAQQQLTAAGLGTVFLALVGSGCLSRLKEARTVSYRILGMAAVPTLTLLLGAGTDGAAWACILLAVFWFPAVTEAPALGRRQRPLVPHDRREALWMLPLLPGCGRGVFYTGVLAVLAVLSGVGTHIVFRGTAPSGDDLLYLMVGVLYMLAYGAGFALVRHTAFEETRLTTSFARLRIPGILLLLWIGCGLIDAGVSAATGRPFFVLSVFIPFVGLQKPPIAMPPGAIAGMLLVVTAGLLIRLVPLLRWSVREVTTGKAAMPRPPGGRHRRRPRRAARR